MYRPISLWKRLLFLSSCFPTQFLRRLITAPQPSTIISQKHLLTTVLDSDKASSPLSSFTVQYLTNTCGLPLKDALAASKKLQLKENKSHKHQSVLDLLRCFEFSSLIPISRNCLLSAPNPPIDGKW